jgi:hypothetical protein
MEHFAGLDGSGGESYGGRALVPSPKRSASPRATSTLQWRIGLKVFDSERPIREADITQTVVMSA